MNPEKIAKYVKAGAAMLLLIGIQVDPDDIEVITSGFIAVYAIITAIQSKYK